MKKSASRSAGWRRFQFLIAAAWLLGAILGRATPCRAAENDIPQRLDKLLADPAIAKSHTGVSICNLSTGKSIYSLRANEVFTPASNMKLLTTAAALDQLGGDFNFVTTFATRGEDLLVFASGDPGLGDERLAKKHDEPTDAALLKVVAAMKKAGITKINGDLIVDCTVFDDEWFHSNWPAKQRGTWYAAEIGSFNFNDNCIDIKVAPGAAGKPPAITLSPDTRFVKVVNKAQADSKSASLWLRREGLTNVITAGGRFDHKSAVLYSVPIHDPPAYTTQVFIDTVARSGIGIAGKVRFERLRNKDGSLPEGITVLSKHEQNLGELLWRCNTFSQNFVAEALFKTVGAYDGKTGLPAAVGTWATGRAAVAAFVKHQGFTAPDGLVIDDGSGFSKANAVSPGLLTDLLVKMAAHKYAETWFNSFAAGGAADGTLRKRFKSLNGDEMVLAKTGTLSTASALSGYVRGKDGKQYAFSILADHLAGDTSRARKLADQIVMVLTGGKAAGKSEEKAPDKVAPDAGPDDPKAMLEKVSAEKAMEKANLRK